MKQTFIIFLVILVQLAQAQNRDSSQVLTNKKGIAILPQPGDWAIGISAQPFLEYAGNMLTAAFNPAPIFTSANPGLFYAKYTLNNNTAIRGGLSIGISSNTDKNINPTDPDKYDKYKESSLSIGITLGIEKYKNFKSRLRGYYGADLGIEKSSYFGPSLGFGGMVSGKYSFEDAVDIPNDYKEVGGNTYTLAARGVIGLEYFIAPKISISGEFGITAYGSVTGDRTYIPETGAEITLNPGSSSFGIILNTNSLVNLFFYF